MVVHIVFAATSDYAPFALTTSLSVVDKVKSEKCHIHFMYADIVRKIHHITREDTLDMMKSTLALHGADCSIYNIESLVYKLKGQNIGLWGESISLTHYFYLLAPEVLDVDKVIFLDTDMIVNTDLSEAYKTDMGNCLLGMGAPRGFESMGDDVCNSGFVVMNLNLWRKEKTLDTLLEFGRTIQKCNFCDQNLLHQYFTKKHADRLFLFDKSYNIFPQCFGDMKLCEMKILHYTGWGATKPWLDDLAHLGRATSLWWFYARQTPFYEWLKKRNEERNIKRDERKYFGWKTIGLQKRAFYAFGRPILKREKKEKPAK